MQVERDLRNMSRERFLPDEKTLEKIIRCEAYLYRQPYQALHELEALQTKRSGGALLWPASRCRASKAKTAKRTSPSRLAVDSGLQGY